MTRTYSKPRDAVRQSVLIIGPCVRGGSNPILTNDNTVLVMGLYFRGGRNSNYSKLSGHLRMSLP